MDRFHFCTHLTITPDEKIAVSDLPKEGDWVYKGRTPIRLMKIIGDGGEGVVYKTSESENVVAKVYSYKK